MARNPWLPAATAIVNRAKHRGSECLLPEACRKSDNSAKASRIAGCCIGSISATYYRAILTYPSLITLRIKK
jgi:hypothetical protein